MPRLRRSPILLIAVALLAVTALACADPIKQAPQQYARLELERAPLESLYSTTPGAAEAQRRRVARAAPRIEQEREWYAGQFGDPDAVAEFDSNEGMLAWAEPATEEALVWMEDVAQKTAARRGLALETMPPIYIISRESFRTALCSLLLHPDSAEADPLWRFDRLLGNIDASWTPSVMRRLAWSHVAAWYVPVDQGRGGHMVLVNGTPPPRRYLPIFSHEIVHALQDAHFGLNNNTPEDLGSTDAADALAWVYEGDASFSTVAWKELQEITEVPGFEWSHMSYAPLPISLYEALPLRAELRFRTYRLGSAAVAAMHAEQGYDGVNRLFMQRPSSTTQMLHPEALASDWQPIGREAICALTPALLGDLPCEGYPQSDRLGEAFLRTFIAESTEQLEPAIKAAAGWRGDLIRFADGESDLVLWQIVFANETEHNEAAAELRNWLIARSGGWARAAVGAPVIAWDGPAGAIRILDHARMLWLILSNNPSFTDQVTRSALQITARPDWWDE